MNIVSILFVVAMCVANLFMFPLLPNSIPMHWNVYGQVDNYMPKNYAVWFLPVLTAVMVFSFWLTPFFDPKKEKYTLFKHEWFIMQSIITGFMVYMQFMILYLSVYPNVPMIPLMFVGLGLLFILLGNYMSKIRQNYFIGVKTPWALANEDNWNKTHRYASWTFVISGFVTLAEAFLVWHAPIIVFGGICGASILPVIYSFFLFKKTPEKMKYVYAVAIVGIAVLIVLT